MSEKIRRARRYNGAYMKGGSNRYFTGRDGVHRIRSYKPTLIERLIILFNRIFRKQSILTISGDLLERHNESSRKVSKGKAKD